MSESRHAATYPTEEQYERWQTHAEEMGMRSMSEFVEAMVEAGIKKFDASSIQPDETNQELRQQRNDLKTELDAARHRIQELEDAAYHGERQEIKDFIETNPGANYDEIIQHIIDTIPERVTVHLDQMEGDYLRVEEGRYYTREEINSVMEVA